MRYVIDLRRTADNRVEGVLRREGTTQPVPFSGWIELATLLEPPPLDPTGEPRAAAEEDWRLPGLL